MSASRDLVGYGATPPDPRWPDGAKVAVQCVINYEEGGENSVLHGDKGSEAFLSEMVGAQSHVGMRAMAMESLYEYGSRAGFWRLHRLFTERGLPLTVFGVAKAMEANPAAVEAMLAAGWEIASHGYRWIDYQYVDEAVEREPSPAPSNCTPRSPAAARRAGTRAAPAPTPRGWWWKKADSSTTPTAMPTTCPITTHDFAAAACASRSWSCPTRWMSTT
jgi:hypothetical protein